MKTLALLATLLTCTGLYAQRPPADTLYRYKSKDGCCDHYVYINRARVAPKPDIVKAFKKPEFKNEIARLDTEVTWQKFRIAGINRHWVKVYQHNGQFYLYDPCDGLFEYAFYITDSSTVEITGEGPFVSNITGYERINEQTFRFKTVLSYLGEVDITIYIIDEEKGLSVFAVGPPGSRTYHLMAAVQRGFYFPTIVCSSTQKESEFEFELPDYKKLLNGKE